MTPSLRLLLEDFLGLMREEGELDVFLPLLMSAMGHEVVYRAQKGTRQYGVDISSVGRDEDGKKKLFLWLVKCGDINRSDWNSGPQAIRQSIEDVGDTYLRSHVAPQHFRLPKKLLVVTNGDFTASLNETIAGFLEIWSRQKRVEAMTVNGSTLAAWTEHYLLDEYVLPASNRALLRRMLANVNSPELCISVGHTLFDSMVKGAKEPARSKAARKKRLLTGLRGVRTALSVLQVWAHNENNLLAPYRLAEFAVLSVWANLHDEVSKGERPVIQEFADLLLQLTAIAEAYHQRLQPYYVTQDAFAHALPDNLLVTDAVFQEIGRIGLQGYIWAAQAVESKNELAAQMASVYTNRLIALLSSHSCSQSPSYDYHATDIHVGLLLLALANRKDDAKIWIHHMVLRLGHAANKPKFWPLSAPFEEALLIRYGYEEASEEFRSTSTLIPVLLIWTAALGMDDSYHFIRDRILPLIPQTTPNFWSPDKGFDELVANPVALQQHGVGEAVLSIAAEPEQFVRKMSAPLPGVESIEEAVWQKVRAEYVPLLAALRWQLQVPREMMVKQAIGAAGYVFPCASASTTTSVDE